MRQIITISEAALELRVHPETVRRLIRDGKLKAIRIGRALRIDRRELDRLTAEGVSHG